MESFWKESSFPKELVGVRHLFKNFKNYKLPPSLPWKFYKTHNQLLSLQDSQPVVESTSSTQGPRRSSRIHHDPKRYGFLVTDDKTIELVDQDEPTTYHEAMMSPDSEKWLQAMKYEM